MNAPDGWSVIERRVDGIAAQQGNLRVIASAAVEQDGQRWLHVSLSRPKSIPNWVDVRKVKREWLGDAEGYMVFPPEHRYVNLNPYVLHLWSCLDAPGGVLPAFEGNLIDGSKTI